MVVIINDSINYVVYADSLAAETQYEIEFSNGTIFYMFTRDNPQKSGLYYNTEPFDMIYELESGSYFYESGLIFTEDGLHFAYLPWTTYDSNKEQGGVAVYFYSNGCLTNKYLLSEVVTNQKIFTPSVSHVIWEDRSRRSFDDESNVLTLESLDGTVCSFDLTTGLLISRFPAGGVICIYPACSNLSNSFVVVTILVLCFTFAIKRTRSQYH